MRNQYETVFIVTPVLSDVQVKETVKKFKDYVTENGGEFMNVEDWGLRKLAYPIQKKTTGFYNLFEFQADPDMIKKLEIQFKRDERIIRFLSFRLDKHSIAYSEKRINKSKVKTEKEA